MHFTSDTLHSGKTLNTLILLLCILEQFIKIDTAAENNFLIPECFFHDFRMIELLKLKKSLANYDDTCSTPALCMASDGSATNNTTIEQSAATSNSSDKDAPAAMALKADARGFPTSVDYNSWHHIEEEHQKPSKLQTLFQITITALSFLSFGGYLLCLIVQTIKSKGTTYFHPVATAATATKKGTQRIKVYRRSRRNANGKDAAKESEDDMDLALPDPTEMYNVLVQFAEGYVRTLE